VLLVIAMVWTMRIGSAGAAHGQQPAAHGSVWANLVEGLLYIRRSRVILALMSVTIISIYLETTYQQLLPVFAANLPEDGGPALAKMVTAVGIGSVVGGFIMAALSNHPRKGVLMLVIGMFSGVSLAVFAVSTWMPLTLTMLGITGLTQAVTMAMGQTMVNLVVANEYRGRVMSVFMMLWSSSPLAMLPAGWATDHYGAPITVFVSGILVVLLFLVASNRRGVVWNFREDGPRVLTPA
jgi:MFS family permease